MLKKTHGQARFISPEFRKGSPATLPLPTDSTPIFRQISPVRGRAWRRALCNETRSSFRVSCITMFPQGDVSRCAVYNAVRRVVARSCFCSLGRFAIDTVFEYWYGSSHSGESDEKATNYCSTVLVTRYGPQSVATHVECFLPQNCNISSFFKYIYV